MPLSEPALVQPGWRVYEVEVEGGGRRHSGEVQSVFYKPTNGPARVNSVLCTHFMRVGHYVHPVVLYLSGKGEWKNALMKDARYEVEEG